MSRRFVPIILALVLTSFAERNTRAQEIPFDKLTARWTNAIDQYNIPGLTVAVVRDGKTVYTRAFGHRDTHRAIPATTDTMYYIASTTKSFTALATLHLADRGLVDLDAPVTTYLPRFTLAETEPSTPITVRDLLSHRRGLQGEEPLSLHEAYTGHPITDDFFYSRLAAYVHPTDTFRYGNLHFTLLGRIIEAASGKDWKTYLKQELLNPAGMHRTTAFLAEARTLGNVADMMFFSTPTEWRAPDIVKTEHSMSAAGGIYASVNDLATWLKLHMNDGNINGKQLLSAGAVRETRSSQTEVNSRFGEFQRESYGLGWYVGSYADEQLVHCFGAFTSGARSHLSYMPEHNIGVAVLTNVSRGPGHQLTDAIAADIYDAVLGSESPPDRIESLRARITETPRNALEQIPAPSRNNNPAIAEDALSIAASAYLGEFENPDFGTVRFFMKDEQLTMRYAGLTNCPLTTFRGQDTFIVFLIPRSLAAVGQFIVKDGTVESLAIDLPGTPEGVAMFTRN